MGILAFGMPIYHSICCIVGTPQIQRERINEDTNSINQLDFGGMLKVINSMKNKDAKISNFEY